MSRLKIIFLACLLAGFIILEAFLENHKKKLEEEVLNQLKHYEQLQTDLNSVSAEYSSIVNEPKLRVFANSRNFLDFNSYNLEIKK